MALSRLSRFWHVGVTAAPFFLAAASCRGSAVNPPPSPVRRRQRALYYPDSRCPPPSLHTHPRSPIGWLPPLAPVVCVARDLDDTHAFTARMRMRMSVLMR